MFAILYTIKKLSEGGFLLVNFLFLYDFFFSSRGLYGKFKYEFGEQRVSSCVTLKSFAPFK